MKRFSFICAVMVLGICSAGSAQIEVIVKDMTPIVPLANPSPSSYGPRYISGFGSGDSFAVFFEDRDNDYTINYVTTTNGPTGFPSTATSTNIKDTHFCVKNWPITIGGTNYDYR